MDLLKDSQDNPNELSGAVNGKNVNTFKDSHMLDSTSYVINMLEDFQGDISNEQSSVVTCKSIAYTSSNGYASDNTFNVMDILNDSQDVSTEQFITVTSKRNICIPSDSLCNNIKCKNTLKKNDTLRTQILNHSTEKPFSCNICYEKFANRNYLMAHMQIHMGKRPYVRNICKTEFGQKGNLVNYVRVHTDTKPFACEICKAKYTQMSGLMKHRRIHTGEKPFSCDMCNNCYAARSHLDRHFLAVHSGIKPYSCEICKRGFTQRGSLITHRRAHTVEVFPCLVCKKEFFSLGGLSTHSRMHKQKV